MYSFYLSDFHLEKNNPSNKKMLKLAERVKVVRGLRSKNQLEFKKIRDKLTLMEPIF